MTGERRTANPFRGREVVAKLSCMSAARHFVAFTALFVIACSSSDGSEDAPGHIDGTLSLDGVSKTFSHEMSVLGGVHQIDLVSGSGKVTDGVFDFTIRLTPTLDRNPANYDLSTLDARSAPLTVDLYVPEPGAKRSTSMRKGIVAVTHSPSVSEPWFAAKLTNLETTLLGSNYHFEGSVKANISREHVRTFWSP